MTFDWPLERHWRDVDLPPDIRMEGHSDRLIAVLFEIQNENLDTPFDKPHSHWI